MNWNNVHICLPIQIKKSTNETNDINAVMVTVTIFFAHWIKEIDTKRYRDDFMEILPATKMTEVYRHSDAMLKHILRDALETFENTLLYSRKKVKLPTDQDSRLHNNNNTANRTDSNLQNELQNLST